MFSTTYYDSQSGMHVPQHNEGEITAYGHYHHSSSGFQKLVKSMHNTGYVGMIMMPASSEHVASSSDEDDLVDVPPAFHVFAPEDAFSEICKNLHIMFDFCVDSDDDVKSLREERLSVHSSSGRPTCLALRNDSNYTTDPIIVANGVASVMDATNGSDHICLVASDGIDAEAVWSLAEELVYLDVPGPTIKSRLIVDLAHSMDKDETIEECLRMGVNKYVVSPTDFDWFESIVEENGKIWKKSS